MLIYSCKSCGTVLKGKLSPYCPNCDRVLWDKGLCIGAIDIASKNS